MSDTTSVLHRHPKTRNFTQVENGTIRDSALSFRATGLLIYLLSLPDGAKIDSNTLTPRKTEGRDAIRSAYGELEAAGYVNREKVQRANDGRWTTIIHVYEVPETDSQASGTQASGIQASVSQAVEVKGSKTEEKDGKSDLGFGCPTHCGTRFATIDERDDHYIGCEWTPASEIEATG